MAVSVISFFAGCGGSSLGYRMAGCGILLACDFERRAIEIYRRNFPGARTLCADIRQVSGNDVMKLTGLGKGQLDILDGSPPCTAFSMCGIREKGWGKVYNHNSESKAQRSDDLFFEYVRLVGELKPKAFIAENVPGLMRGAAKGYFNEIIGKSTALGYDVKAFLLNAKHYDVPQSRERVFFIGMRGDIQQDTTVEFKRRPPISFYIATRNLRIPDEELERAARLNNVSRSAILMKTRQGMQVSKIHPLGSGYNSTRCSMDKPVPTMVAHSNMLIHPTENRWLTLSELKRCATYPDDFWFPSQGEGGVRMGNSVPPKLAMHVARYVIARAKLS